MLAFVAPFLLLSSDTLVFNGRQRQLELAPPRIEARAEIDGILDEPVWERAARLTGFSSYFPTDGRPAADSTEVRVWYSPVAIHFGIRAFAPRGSVRATLAQRDNLEQDDVISLFVGTFNDNRQAYLFAVNPFGVQQDGVLVEGAAVAGNPGDMTAGIAGGRKLADPSPDFIYHSKGRLTETGFEVEVEIPFKSIRFPGGAVQVWGIHIERTHRATGAVSSWVPARRDAASYLSQSGRLTGLRELRRGLVLELTPSVTSTTIGVRLPSGEWDRTGGSPSFGGDVRWGVTTNLTLNGTVRPDFSQVESDAGQVSFDPRAALYFSEKRPFFLDGIELFQSPTELVYTRRIVRPVAATKLTGKVSGSTVAFLAAVDDRAASAAGDRSPVFGLARVQRDVGGSSRIGALYTGRFDGNRTNQVLALDGRFAFGEATSLEVQVAGSRTEVAGVRSIGPMWNAALTRNGRRWSLRWTTDAIADDFEAGAGFFARRNIANARLVNQVTFYGRPGGFVERLSLDFSPFLTWRYVDLVAGRGLQDDKWHLNSNWRLRGGWSITASLLWEYQRFDPDFYAGHRLLRPRPGAAPDTLAFAPPSRLNNRDWLLSLSTPELSGVSGSVFAIGGRDVNFFEWTRANILSINAALSWRPTDQLRLDGTYIHQRYDRHVDGSNVGITRIPRLRVEYQLSRSLFLRLVGEYRVERQDSLRDAGRTGYPIAVFDPATGRFERAGAVDRRTLRADWLVAFQPNPGTVFFAGYGTAGDEDPIRRRPGFVRQADAFFVKASYLLRL